MTESGDRRDDDVCGDLVLPAVPSSPRAARHFLGDTLRRCQVTSGIVDLATLLTSELVTNAVRHGRGRVRLSVRAAPPAVRIEVFDDNPALPVLGPKDDLSAESGRGLRLVDTLASRWGTEPHPELGKEVWFELDLREA